MAHLDAQRGKFRPSGRIVQQNGHFFPEEGRFRRKKRRERVLRCKAARDARRSVNDGFMAFLRCSQAHTARRPAAAAAPKERSAFGCLSERMPGRAEKCVYYARGSLEIHFALCQSCQLIPPVTIRRACMWQRRGGGGHPDK